MILRGVRVVDLSMGWAGPLAAMLLADFGAEIVKIESTRHLDWWRGGDIGKGPEDRPYEKLATFNSVNRNKYGCTVDLQDPRGMALLKRLIAISDVLVENFTPRVMPNLGLTYDAIRAINPTLVTISMPAFGNSGPWRNYAGYGNTVEALSGLTGLTGYSDGPPTLQSNAYGDPVSGIGGAIAVLMALVHRWRTGRGQHIELSDQEMVVHHVSQALLDYALNGRVQERPGNRHPWMAPHGVYPCRGEDVWIAIAVASDEEWRALCTTLGHPEVIADARFADGLSRWHHQDDLDPLLCAWTVEWDRRELAEHLQRAGVAAATVNSNAEVLNDPQIQARHSFVWMDRRYVGYHPYTGIPARLSHTPGSIHKPAPTLGEDNAFLLGNLLNLTGEEVTALERDGVIGDQPDRGER
ncbi:MAG: CoA transferase [Chloroflexi bacterium]|nr:CoA transferase [Chloroflexota bacterium]